MIAAGTSPPGSRDDRLERALPPPAARRARAHRGGTRPRKPERLLGLGFAHIVCSRASNRQVSLHVFSQVLSHACRSHALAKARCQPDAGAIHRKIEVLTRERSRSRSAPQQRTDPPPVTDISKSRAGTAGRGHCRGRPENKAGSSALGRSRPAPSHDNGGVRPT